LTEPLRLAAGLHPAVAPADYHADCAIEPSLSSSLAKVLVAQTPKHAWLQHPRLNPKFKPEDDDKFALGSAVHDYLAGGAARIKIVTGFKDWKKDAAQEQRAAARAAGLIPLLTHQFEQVIDIAAVAKETAVKEGISLGMQECVLIAEDKGAWLRAMMDSFAPPWINDWKISKINLANDAALARHMVDMGYDMRAAFYIHVAELVFPDLAGRINFRWLFLEEDEPFGLRIIEADATMREMGRRKMQYAIDIWRECLGNGRWPHFENLPRRLAYPDWKEREWLEREVAPTSVMGPVEMLGRMDGGQL
jgi:hypothetical protein